MNCVEEPCAKKLKVENGSAKHVNDFEKYEKTIKVGSRKSQLALFQSNYVVKLLKKVQAELSYEIITMTTTGDKILDVALSKIGDKSLFTKELEVSLENGDIDVVVHSLKDLSTTLPPGMVIAGICKRENPLDVVIFRPDSKYSNLEQLPPGSVVGTSSLRRIAQLKRLYPHLQFNSIRGNLNTRFRKLDEGGTFSAIVLAAAGVIRLDLAHRIGQTLPSAECLYAVGQGALAVECKESDLDTVRLLSQISDRDTVLRCVAERAFMRSLEGGCSVPVAVSSQMDEEDNKLTLEGGVFSLDGSRSLREKLAVQMKPHDDGVVVRKKNYVGIVAFHIPCSLLQSAENLGVELADLLLKKGAGDILKEARKNPIL